MYFKLCFFLYLLMSFRNVFCILNTTMGKNYSEPCVDCAIKIITRFNTTDTVFINMQDNDMLRSILNRINSKVIQRPFFASTLKLVNEVYIFSVDDFEEAEEGLVNLTKDFFWNPKALFVILGQFLSRKEATKVFEKLHSLYVFKAFLITAKINDDEASVFIYNFNHTNRCLFIESSMQKINCRLVTNNLIKMLSETENISRNSGCIVKLLLIPSVPNVITNKLHADDYGLEEFLYFTMKERGLVNFTFLNPTNFSVGYFTENYTAMGSFRMIKDGEIDGVVGGILLSLSRIGLTDIVYPHSSDDFNIVVSKAHYRTRWKSILFVFTPGVLGMLLIAFITFCILSLRLNAFHRNKTGYIVLMAYGYFVGNSQNRIRDNVKVKCLIATWVFFTWLIVCYFQSALASVFTKPSHDWQIDDLDEIVNNKYEFHLLDLYYYYINRTNAFNFRRLLDKVDLCNNYLQCFEKVARGTKDFTSCPNRIYTFNKYQLIGEDGEIAVHVLKHPIAQIREIAYMKKGHPDLARIRFYERQLIAGGIYTKNMNDIFLKNYLKHTPNSTSKFHVLSLTDVAGNFYFLLIGSFVSCVILLVELCLDKNHL